MLNITTLQLSALALAAVLSGSAIPAAAEEETSAAAVLDHHVQAFANGVSVVRVFETDGRLIQRRLWPIWLVL